MLNCNSLQRIVPGLAASALLGNLLKMQSLTTTESETLGVEPSNCDFTNTPDNSDAGELLAFENYCSTELKICLEGHRLLI